MNTALMFSTNKDLWSTPQNFYEDLDREFNFTLDPCAIPENAKCSKFYTMRENGLVQSWQGETVFCNPPYGRGIKHWVEKGYIESQKPRTKVVMLIPARTDTEWFHEFIYKRASEIRFIKGRLRFSSYGYNAPFPSMVVVL